MTDLPDRQGQEILLRMEMRLLTLWFRSSRASLAAVEAGDEIKASELRHDANDFLKASIWVCQLRREGKISALPQRADAAQLALPEIR